jgi:hypothetical protein
MDDENLNQDSTRLSTPPAPAPANQGGVIHSAVGDIHVPNSRIPFDMDFKFNPQAPITMPSDQGFGVSTSEKGIQEPKPGFWKTAGAEAYEFNATAEILHAGYSKYEQPDPLQDIPPSDWTPTSNTEMFYDIKPEYMSYLMDARGPKDQQYRRDRILSEQEHDTTLENGSMFARIIGGIGGVLTDPISYIPIAGEVKYAKFAPTILKTAARAFPGLAAVGIAQSGAKQLDKVNGNLHDFVIGAAVNTVFGMGIFGAFKGASLALDKMELWNLRGIAASSIKGVDFKFNLGEKGDIQGIKAFDTTGSLSAAEVSYAQELADSSFNKSGFFKIPYVSDAAIKLAGAPYVGTPIMQMINSPYMTVRGFIDRAAEHGILTKGVAEGGTKPKSFEFLMQREYASLRSISAQMNALHLQRMGIKLDSRPVADVTQIGLGLYNKSLKLLGKDMDKSGYISRDQFHDEVQRVLFSKEPSEHAAVNEAASLMREKIDTTYKNYLKAYNLPEDILDPKTAAGYLMRVYDTPYMNVNKDKWVSTVSNWLKESDETIADRMEPIRSLETQLDNAKKAHEDLIRQQNVSDKQIKTSSDKLEKLKRDVKVANETLQNELRENPELSLHVENLHALSANEANELEKITKPLNDLKKQVDEQQKIVSALKSQKAKSKQSAMKGKTVKTAKKHLEAETGHEEKIKVEEDKLHDLKNKVSDEEYNLYEQARNGDINPRLYYPQTYKLKDVNDRLQFRKTYDNHIARENHAKGYYDSIMHMTPEDTISDVMGKVMGNARENHLKTRTLLLPDELLYNNNFMTKDLMAKLSNYVTYLSRRTTLKNVFKDVTHDGGIEPLIEKLNLEYKSNREPWDKRKSEIAEELKKLDEESGKENLSESAKKRIEEDRKALTDENKKLEKNLKSEAKKFSDAKELMNKSYQRMMGIRQRTPGEQKAKSMIMSITAMTNLHFLPATQIADLGSIGLQHGVWPFVRDAVYPAIESLGGILKTADSEALRKTAPSVHLALQDQLSGYADKNWAMEAQPYLNLGRWVGGIEKLAHFSSNADLTTYIDNGLQRLAGSTVQSEFMRILDASVKGTMTKKESEYLRKYGIDPKVWGERMVKAFKDSQGYKTKLGGYQSKFWEWQDTEAANHFSDAVFRGIKNSIINRGMFDSPFWADNFLGMMFHTFTGWGYASLNRYLIPMLQRPDAQKMLGVALSMGFGAMVSPLRRVIRGEDAVPDNMTDAQRFWETINDSNATSEVANVLSWANLLSGDRILGDLKNDKYRNRMRIGAFGPVVGTVNRMGNIFDALASGEMNQKDALEMAKMLPVTGSIWGYNLSKMLIDKLGLPPTRRAAQAENE